LKLRERQAAHADPDFRGLFCDFTTSNFPSPGLLFRKIGLFKLPKP
jgi:hypothetical protein